MFFRAETLPFLHGHAHAGMVIGAQNILDKTFDALLDAVANNPSYSILVVGYSLGKSFNKAPIKSDEGVKWFFELTNCMLCGKLQCIQCMSLTLKFQSFFQR